MKKRMFSLALVFALLCSCMAIGTIGFTASAETVTKGVIDYTAENPLDGVIAKEAMCVLSDGELILGRNIVYSSTEFANKTPNVPVESAQMKSYVVIPLSFDGELAADSSVYAKFKTGNTGSSNFEAFGVKTADGKTYMATNAYGGFASPRIIANTYVNVTLTGKTLYNIDDTTESITLTTDNFSSSATDSERAVSFVIAMAAYASPDITADVDSSKYVENHSTTVASNKRTGATRYIENIYYTVEKSESSDPVITMDSGASMRLDSKTEGIRFSATVPTADLVALKNSGAKITDFGMLIAPAESNLSTDEMIVVNSVESTVDSIADNAMVVAAKYGNITPADDEKTGLTVIVGSLVEINTTNASKGYVARAYIEYEDADGNTAYIYSAISEARSIAEVAHNIVTAGDGYYDSLCQNHKDVVDNWAKYAV